MKRIFVFRFTVFTIALLLLSACSSSKKIKHDTTGTSKEKVRVTESPVTKIDEEKPIPKEEKQTERMSLRDINFDFDKYDLRPDAFSILAEHVHNLKQHPETSFVIEGHCDEWGSTEYNLALGERRAAAVKNYMVKSGISANRISTISYGKEKPLDSRSTKEAWAKNRRAAFVLKG